MDYQFDFFISYSHKDSWARDWLLPRLEAAGLNVAIDYRDFEIGLPSIINMENMVAASRRVIVVLSPNWLASEWSEFEGLLAQTDDPIGLRRKLLPIMYKDSHLPSRLGKLTWADFREPNNHHAELTRLLMQLGREAPPGEPEDPLPLRLIFQTSPDLKHDSSTDALPFSIKQFAVNRFQCIQQCHISDIPIDTRWIFILGDNGDGKTSLLQALAVGMWGDEDARHLLGERHECQIELEYQTNQMNHINRFRWNNGQWSPVSKPGSFLAYGPSRLLIQGMQSLKDEREQSPVAGLHRQEVHLRNIEEWFQRQRLDAGDRKDPLAYDRISNVKKMLVELMPNVEDILFEGQDVWYIEKGQRVPAHHLSAGHKSILAMIGDMTIRLMEQQPKTVDPKDLFGIVLIDELVVHLHPNWQARYPGILSRVFPKVQFIATTHSPIPLMGAPLESVFLKVTRTKETGTSVERLDLDVTRLLPNTLLTSPLFDMESLINPHNVDLKTLHTETNYWEIEDKEERRAKLQRLAENNILPDFPRFKQDEASE